MTTPLTDIKPYKCVSEIDNCGQAIGKVECPIRAKELDFLVTTPLTDIKPYKCVSEIDNCGQAIGKVECPIRAKELDGVSIVNSLDVRH